MIFSYHSGLHAIQVEVSAAPNVVVMLIQTKALRVAGWHVDEEGLSRCLPRSEIKFPVLPPPYGVGLRILQPEVEFVKDSRFPE
jgi:hypothetical protein